jgi:hypothetical protein
VAVSEESYVRWKVGAKVTKERRQKRPSRRIMENGSKNNMNESNTKYKRERCSRAELIKHHVVKKYGGVEI